MRKLYLLAPLLALFFSFNVQAAVSSATIQGTDSDGLTLNVRYQNYTLVPPIDMNQQGDPAGANKYDFIWEFTENIDVILADDFYYTGWATIAFNPNPSGISGLEFIGVELPNTNATQGLYTYITSVGGGKFNINFVFDNFYTHDTVNGTATFKIRYGYMGSVTASTNLNLSLTPQVTINSRDLHAYTGVQNNALTAMIYSAIEQATDQDFQSILGLLTTIKNQDYTYYNQIINELGVQGQLHYDFTTIYAVLVGLQHNVQDGFDDVQTILDLFPSYRTQVLQYWQQLLEMNASQSSAAADMASQYADKDNQSGQLINGLGSLNLPEVDSDDFNILGNVNSDQKANFFGLIALITNNGLITTILLIIVTGAIVGYALYGKK